MACVLATPGSVPLLAETHAGSLLPCWLGFRQVGLEPSPVLTHWATTTNFMGLLPLPRFRAYLGATTARFGWVTPTSRADTGVVVPHARSPDSAVVPPAPQWNGPVQPSVCSP